MTKRKKQAIILLALSVPMMWFGFTNFMSGTTSNTALAVGTAIGCTFGLFFAISGLVMLATKNSLGIWNHEDKGKKDRGVVLASQANVGDSPISLALNETPEDFINKPSKKVNEMVETNSTSVEMMKREKELEARRKELEGLLKEVRREETELEQSLQEKGWVKKDGEWGIE